MPHLQRSIVVLLINLQVGFIHANQPEPPRRHGRPVYVVRFKDKTIRAWTYEMPDGKLEQFQVAVGN